MAFSSCLFLIDNIHNSSLLSSMVLNGLQETDQGVKIIDRLTLSTGIEYLKVTECLKGTIIRELALHFRVAQDKLVSVVQSRYLKTYLNA